MSGKGIDYSSIWYVFRIKNSRNRGNIRNNEKVVYFSVANTVSCKKRAYFDVTLLDSKKVHEYDIFGQKDTVYYNFSQENPKIKNI